MKQLREMLLEGAALIVLWVVLFAWIYVAMGSV